MELSMFQKLRNYLRQVFQAGTTTPKYIPSSAGFKKSSESSVKSAAPAREARSKSNDDGKTVVKQRHPSDHFSSESQVYKNFR